MLRPVRTAQETATAFAAAAVAVSGSFAMPAFADVMDDASSMHVAMCPDMLAAAQARAQALRDFAARQPGGRIDSAPPVLLSIATNGGVNSQFPNQAITVDLNLKDDLSGVTDYGIAYQSPSKGKCITRDKHVATPLTKLNPTLTVGSTPFSAPPFSVFDEPGTWRAVDFYASDAQGNLLELDGDQLAALGSTTFVLTSSGYDLVPPTFASGTIDTPVVRLSKPPKGTTPGHFPYVSASLSVTDSGNGVVSGNYQAILVMCHPDGFGGCDDSMTLAGTVNQAGNVANTMTAGAPLHEGQRVGQYVIHDLSLYDVAGNTINYTSTTFGGSTNFATYFPTGTTIFVNQ